MKPLLTGVIIGIIIVMISGALVVPPILRADDGPQHYLLMQDILNILGDGDFIRFKDICEEKISINFEPPFELYGYLKISEFVHDIKPMFSQFETEHIEWVSKQLEEQFAVQSLNIILKNKRSEKNIYYKLIFFLTKKTTYYNFFFFSIKKGEEWKIYYIRGLKV